MFLHNSDCSYDSRSALTSSIITHLDPYSRIVNPKRWNENRILHEATYRAVTSTNPLPADIARHFSDPTDLDYIALYDDVQAWVDDCDSSSPEFDDLATNVIDHATQVFCRRSFDTAGPYLTGEPSATTAAIVIPFRAREANDGRLRNLVNTLRWLEAARQDHRGVKVIVVEADSQPRHKDIVESHGGTHLFVRNDGPFNKAAAVNRGYEAAAGLCRNICILDSDGYLDDNFLRISLNAIDTLGTRALMPFRDLFFLDAASTARVLLEGVSRAGSVTGYITRLSPGVCFLVDADILEQVGGLVER